MKIAILNTFSHEVVNASDPQNIIISNKTFNKNDLVEVEIIEDMGKTVDLQFEDASCAFNVPKDNYQIFGILSPEQIKYWRRVLLGTLGPYALIMPDAEVQAIRDRMQEIADEDFTPSH